MRPIRKANSHPKYNPPSTLKLNPKDAAVIAKVMTAPSPTIDDYLDLWLEAIKADEMDKKGHAPANHQDLCDARDVVKRKTQTDYKKAAVPLVDSFGSYCSYCETYVPGLVEVEHVVPKSQYPHFVLAWKNFLLACSPCNQPKSNRPTREELGNLGGDLTKEDNCYDDIRKTYYVWPDTDPLTYRLFPARMVHDPHDNGKWQPVHYLDAIDLDNTITSVDLATQAVRANLPTLGLSGVNVRIEIETSGGTTPPDLVVELCELNVAGAGNTTYDRRVLNRTRAWFEILSAVKQILKIKDPAAFDAAWVLLCMNAASRGFFSLWVRILASGLHRDPNGASLVHRLISGTSQDFRGTDTSYLP